MTNIEEKTPSPIKTLQNIECQISQIKTIEKFISGKIQRKEFLCRKCKYTAERRRLEQMAELSATPGTPATPFICIHNLRNIILLPEKI